MIYRVGESVVCGTLDNRSINTTYGRLFLRGPGGYGWKKMCFEVVGKCRPDLGGKKIRFWCREEPWKCKPLEAALFKGFCWHQIGACGVMTAADPRRPTSGAPREFSRRDGLGEPPPAAVLRRLYLEWSGQNGVVTVDMADPLIELCVFEDQEDDSRARWIYLPAPVAEPGGNLPDAPPAWFKDLDIGWDQNGTDAVHWSRSPGRLHKEDEAECLEYINACKREDVHDFDD